ncbi:MAG TPA: hypothetical protein VGP43_11900 [Chitinophagaceae bacterium]|nr:hypothetical protein [Chitinophagaceae bacterium]
MEASNLKKAGILTLVLVLISIVSWEIYLRNKNYPVSYNDDEGLWSTQRKEIYKPINVATVFIGSSRIKFDLDIPTWESITGENAIQLSFVGTSPRLLLDDLANDKNFKGKVIVDVTEGIFFERNEQMSNWSATKALKYYKKWTPAEKFSSYINKMLESGFIFLDKDKFSLNALLNDLEIPKRKGVWMMPHFPRGFEMCKSKRQNFMMQDFVSDTVKHNKQIANWRFFGDFEKIQGIKGDSLESIFKNVKISVDKIRARGGKVLFVRTPSSGEYWDTERAVYPREQYWDAMLAYTNTPGIHFKDYPETANLFCPEWSHLTPKGAIDYTVAFIKMLEQKGWHFPNKQITASNNIKNKNF